MATFSDETLTAFVDGELDPAQAVEVQLALIADEALARRIERFRYVRRALRSTYDAVVKEPVPDHLLALLNDIGQATPAPSEDETPLADKPIERVSQRGHERLGLGTWVALGASVLLGALVIRALQRRDED